VNPCAQVPWCTWCRAYRRPCTSNPRKGLHLAVVRWLGHILPYRERLYLLIALSRPYHTRGCRVHRPTIAESKTLPTRLLSQTWRTGPLGYPGSAMYGQVGMWVLRYKVVGGCSHLLQPQERAMHSGRPPVQGPTLMSGKTAVQHSRGSYHRVPAVWAAVDFHSEGLSFGCRWFPMS